MPQPYISTPQYTPFYSTPEGRRYITELQNLLRRESAYGIEEAQKGLITSLSGRGMYQGGGLPAGIAQIRTGAQQNLERALSQLATTQYGAEAGRYENYLSRLLQTQALQQQQYQFEQEQPDFWEVLAQIIMSLGSSAVQGAATGAMIG